MKIFLIPIIFIYSLPIMASPLRLADVVSSARNHYPAIIQAKENLTQREGDKRNRQGSFDAKLTGDNIYVTTGYYRRRYNELKLKRPLGVMGSSVYAGYSRAYPGIFPPQYSTMSTNSGGTPVFGGSVSLIKNAMIDEPRAQIKLSDLEVNQAKQDIKWSEIEVTKASAFHYWHWLEQARINSIYQNLLEMAVKRDEILSQRVKSGDTSLIVKKENLQYISRREAELATTKIELSRSALDLSLFLRDEKGQVTRPTVPHPNEILAELAEAEQQAMNDLENLKSNNLAESIIDNRPDFQRMKFELDKNQIEQRMGKNDTLPALDFSMDYTRNLGNEDRTNAAHVVTFFIKFEIPIEYDLGLGRIQSANARNRLLDSQFSFMKENLRNELAKYEEILNISKNKLNSTRNEVKFAKDLLEAEYIRFKNGNSNLFLVNLREENLASAEEGEARALIELLQFYTEFKVVTMRL